MNDRIPYLGLAPEEQEEVHAWLREHRIEPGRVPVEADFEYDPTTGEWRIPLHWLDADGHRRIDLNPGGDIRRIVVRRRELRPLPWPRFGLRLLGPFSHVSLGGVDLTPYISEISVGGQRYAQAEGGGRHG